jgi:hypothetical protein
MKSTSKSVSRMAVVLPGGEKGVEKVGPRPAHVERQVADQRLLLSRSTA